MRLKMRARLSWALAALALGSALPAAAQDASGAESATLLEEVAPFIRARGTATDALGSADLALLIDRDDAMIVEIKGGKAIGSLPIQNVSDVLRVLADRRLDFMWPALIEWGGPDLEKLRQRAVATATKRFQEKTALPPRTPSESSVRAPTRAVLQLADALDRAGRRGEAIALLRRNVDQGPRRSDWGRAEYSVVVAQLARMLLVDNQIAASIAVLEVGSQKLAKSHYALNVQITLALILAQSGAYARALEALDRTEDAFDASAPNMAADYHLPGSDRHFAMIRSCALRGVGRADEAERELSKVLNAPEPRDRSWVLLKNSTVAYHALLCTGDVERLAVFMADRLQAPGVAQWVLLELQPEYEAPAMYQRIVEAVRAHPAVKVAASQRMRVLPAELVPALNRRPVAQ